MDVLLVESHPGLGDRAEVELRNAGHRVVRCIERHRPPGASAAPCVGLEINGRCPLDGHEVSAAVLAHVGDEFTSGEHGVLCAARHRIPVVTVRHGARPARLGQLVTPASDDLAATVEQAAVAGTHHAGAVVRELLSLGVVSRDEVEGDDPVLAVDVRRGARRLDMTLWLHRDEPRSDAIVRAASQALRRYDPGSPVVDVHVRHLDRGAPVD